LQGGYDVIYLYLYQTKQAPNMYSIINNATIYYFSTKNFSVDIDT